MTVRAKDFMYAACTWSTLVCTTNHNSNTTKQLPLPRMYILKMLRLLTKNTYTFSFCMLFILHKAAKTKPQAARIVAFNLDSHPRENEPKCSRPCSHGLYIFFFYSLLHSMIEHSFFHIFIRLIYARSLFCVIL